MAKEPEFDLQAAHRHFSAACFNQAWDLIDKKDRTTEEDETMIRLCFASAWHWSQRPDCTPANLSVSYWQTARVFALVGQAENARCYAHRCLEICREASLEPFYTAYAYEALARAEALAGKPDRLEEYLQLAHQQAGLVQDEESRKMLLDDLAGIAGGD